jgi:predicted nucleic acid-binding Zn ribbon protein
MRCSNCGHVVPKTEAFCAYCGNKLEKPRRRIRNLLLLLLGIAPIAAFAFGYYFYGVLLQLVDILPYERPADLGIIVEKISLTPTPTIGQRRSTPTPTPKPIARDIYYTPDRASPLTAGEWVEMSLNHWLSRFC